MNINKVKPYLLKSMLPPAYQQVECLKSTGEQWIDSGVYGDQNTRNITKFRYTDNAKGYRTFGSQTEDRLNCFRWGSSVSDTYIIGYGSTLIRTGVPNTDIHIIDFNKNICYLDGSDLCTFPPEVFQTIKTLTLFAVNIPNNIMTDMARCEFYYSQIYANDVLVRNFVPCYRKSDNKPGMYDTVNDVFYTNANTSATQDFIVGENVNKYLLEPVRFNLLIDNARQQVRPNLLARSILPSAYQQVEYLESTGEQYINTSYYANNNTDVMAIVAKNTSTAQRFFGNMSDINAAYCLTLFGSDSAYIRYGNGQGFASPTSSDYIGKYSVRSDYKGYYIDDNLVHSWLPSGTWRANNNGSRIFYYYSRYAVIKLYSLIIKENDMVIRNFIPCYRKADNKPGLYDLVNDVFYTNANVSASTDFLVGPDIN